MQRLELNGLIPTEASLHVYSFCFILVDVALEEVSFVFDFGEGGVVGVVVFPVLLLRGVSLI